MSQYNIFKAIPLSFYSKDLYRDVAINWGGKSFGYLFVLIVLTWIIPTILIQKGINKEYAKSSQKYVKQIPTLTLHNGVLSTPEKRPYLITEPDTGKVMVIIDTSGRYTNLDQTTALLLITDQEFITKKENERRIYQIPSRYNQVIVPVVVNQYLKNLISFAWIFVYLFGVLLIYLYRIIQALIYSLIGKMFASVKGISLNYGQVLSLSMVAVTPAIIISLLLGSFDIEFRFQFLFYFILTLFYLFYGIVANKNKDKT